MSQESTIAKTPKPILGLLALAMIAALVGALLGLFHFNQEEDNVALSTVQKLTDKPVRVGVADEKNNLFVTDGESVWLTKMVKVNGQWMAQDVEKEGTFQ